MTQEEKRIKIAEACGWKPDDDGAGLNTWDASRIGDKLYGLRPRFRAGGSIASYTVDCLVPQYFKSLEAMYEAEKVLDQKQAKAYSDLLSNSKQDGSWAGCYTWHLTAEQRAEEWGKALNLW